MKTDLNTMQYHVAQWAAKCFGIEQVKDQRVRALRLLEEAIEYAQACEVDPQQMQKLLDYVLERPAGEPGQELGGVMITALCAAESQSLDLEKCLEREWARIRSKSLDYFAARNKVKVDAGFGVS